MDLNRLNPFIRVAMHSLLKCGMIICDRALFDYEFIYIEKGGMLFGYGGKSYECRQGQFLLIEPGVSHSFDCRYGDMSQPHIHFDMVYSPVSHNIPVSYKDLDRFSPYERSIMQENHFIGRKNSPFVTFREPEQAKKLLYEIITEHMEKNDLQAKILMFKLIGMIVCDNFPEIIYDEKKECYDVIDQIKDFIDAGQGMNMSLRDFERQFSYSQFYLERKFQGKYNMGLISYRNEKRFDLACTMLCNNRVSDTAEQLGFSSVYVFSRAFKARFGITATEYKKTLTDSSVK